MAERAGGIRQMEDRRSAKKGKRKVRQKLRERGHVRLVWETLFKSL